MIQKTNLSKFGYVRLAVATPEMRIADTEFNTNNIIETAKFAKRNSCYLLLFPELCITGYTCGDLFFQSKLISNAEESIVKLADFTKEAKTTLVVGSPIFANNRLYNCGIVISNGSIVGVVPKSYLPNTNEYYEERWFSKESDRNIDTIEIASKSIPFGADLIFHHTGLPDFKFGIELCEDLWTINPPSFDLTSTGADLILNLSAGSEYLGKSEYRRNLVVGQSARCIAAYALSSAGPNESSSDLIFSGHNLICENGLLLGESNRFIFDTHITFSDIDIEKIKNDRLKNNSYRRNISNRNYRVAEFGMPATSDKKLVRKISRTPFIPEDQTKRAEVCKEIFSLQTTGLIQRLKTTHINSIVIGISGGLDSTLALLVVDKAFKSYGLKSSDIIAVTMPGFGTTTRTKNNAILLAEKLKVNLKTVSIKKAVEQHFKDINHNPENLNIVFENSQARERTQILMDIANQVNGLVIGTGDLSESALGWSTFNGDHISMYNVNCGVPKTLVRYLIEWCSNEEYPEDIQKILIDISNTPISPELLPSDKSGKIIQETEKSIGPYILNDFFLYHFIRNGFSPEKILLLAQIAFQEEYERHEIKKWLQLFIQRFFKNQFKRNCVPDGPKVGSIALSPRGDWRMPSEASYQEWLKF